MVHLGRLLFPPPVTRGLADPGGDLAELPETMQVYTRWSCVQELSLPVVGDNRSQSAIRPPYVQSDCSYHQSCYIVNLIMNLFSSGDSGGAEQTALPLVGR